MADVTIRYKGSSIATMDASGSKTLETGGNYCEDDIEVEYVKPSGSGGFVVTETPDVHGGTVLDITGVEYVAVHGNATPSETAQTVTPPAGKLYDEFEVGAIPSNYVGSGVTRKAAATYTPSEQAQTIPAGQYLDGDQTINPIPSQYVVPSGNKTIDQNGQNIDVAAYSTVSVEVPAGKAVQIAPGFGRTNQTSYTAISGQEITVAKTGTYHVYWTGFRSSTSGSNGSALYVDDSAHTSGNQTTFDGTLTNCQSVHLTNVSLTKDQVITVRARARGTQYYMYVFGLTIIEA